MPTINFRFLQTSESGEQPVRESRGQLREAHEWIALLYKPGRSTRYKAWHLHAGGCHPRVDSGAGLARTPNSPPVPAARAPRPPDNVLWAGYAGKHPAVTLAGKERRPTTLFRNAW